MSAATLHDHAARLLVGTGIDPATAAAVAAGQTPASGPAADALRDGWTASKPVPAHPDPEPMEGPTP